MGKNRFLYLLVLVFAASYYLLYSFWISWYLLVLVLMFPLFDLFISLPGMLSRRVSLSAPQLLEQGEEGRLTITARSKTRFPAGWIKARLHALADRHTVKYRLKCGGEQGSKMELAIDTSLSGVTFFELPLLWVCSLMGLFSVPISVKNRIGVLILPPPIKPQSTARLSTSCILRPKPGGGFSEETDIRPYRQGDPMNSVHWKLSAKCDTLIVREPLEPLPQSRLVHCAIWKTPEERDLILGRLLWISDYLLTHDCPYFVRMGDGGQIAEIGKFEDLVRFLYSALDSGAGSKQQSVDTPFTWVFQVDAR